MLLGCGGGVVKLVVVVRLVLVGGREGLIATRSGGTYCLLLVRGAASARAAGAAGASVTAHFDGWVGGWGGGWELVVVFVWCCG